MLDATKYQYNEHFSVSLKVRKASTVYLYKKRLFICQDIKLVYYVSITF